ncbi:hypothetical protein PVAP13_2KG428215 [Panicum virgatum]|uniref:Uncharacterized protein n=1 Tax=Panicum virgatum TaxID=38727 RepID=A0A8T0WI40_PANVG|nr:hypothetical protein PVAP13_2KG428100 [Panicum virgatum]KAG2645510.1 hypothetical protein PVAP13_2KG428215 [Panicum virgatum]
MVRRGDDEHRVPLGDITNTQKRKTGSNKMSRELEGDADLTAVKRQKAREHYANMPPEKKAELNAKKRENYHQRQEEKRSLAMTDTPQSGVLHVHEVPCLMDTPPSAVFHISGSAGLSCTPSSALLHVDGTTVFSQTMGVLQVSKNTCSVINIQQEYYMPLVCRCPTKFFYCQ